MVSLRIVLSTLLSLWCIVLASLLYAANTTVLTVNPQLLMPIHKAQACLNAKLSVNSNSIWYTQATLVITNNCNAPQNLNNAVVSFQSNSNNITAMWGGQNSSSNFTYTGKIASAVLSILTGNVAANGGKLTLNFGINLTGTAFDLASANSTLQVVPNTPIPSNGAISVNVDPAGVIGYTGTAEIAISGPGLAQPYVITNSNWTSPSTYLVQGLLYGTYSITVKPIGTSYLGSAQPASVTLGSSTPVPVAVSYVMAPPTGSLQINLGAAPLTNIPATVSATLTDNTTQQSQTVTVAWNGFSLINNLPVGDNYTVTFPSVSNGVATSLPNAIPAPIIALNRTTPLNVSYQTAVPTPTQSVVFNVSGLTAGVTGMLTVLDTYGNKFQQALANNGQFTQALPVNDSFAANATATNLSATVTPSSFVLSSTTQPPTVAVFYSTSTTPNTSANFFAYADSGIQTNNNGLIPPRGANMVEAFVLYNPFSGRTDLWAITQGDNFSQIIKNTPNTFASVGGANGPYPWDYESVAKGVAEIEQVAKYYGFIGLDWDIEGAALETPSVQQWVAQAVLQIKKDMPNLIQTLTVPDPVIGFTTGTVAIINLTRSLNNNQMPFDWVNKMNFDENGLGNGCSQTTTDMSNSCLVLSASSGAQALATLLNIPLAQAYQRLGEIFMIPVDDQGHALPLSLATTVATTIKNLGVTHMGYWKLQSDPNFTYANMYTHVLGLT